MIWEWIYSLFADMVTDMVSGFPPIDGADDAAVGVSNILGPVSSGLTGLGGWIPWDVVTILLPISVTLYLAGFVLRGLKAFIPGLA